MIKELIKLLMWVTILACVASVIYNIWGYNHYTFIIAVIVNFVILKILR